jgi:hypothetical protein
LAGVSDILELDNAPALIEGTAPEKLESARDRIAHECRSFETSDSHVVATNMVNRLECPPVWAGKYSNLITAPPSWRISLAHPRGEEKGAVVCSGYAWSTGPPFRNVLVGLQNHFVLR